MNACRFPVLPLALIVLASAARGQDLLGVTWTGATVLINSHSGAVTPLGMGLFGQNGLGRTADGTFWSTHRTTSNAHRYTTIDPRTGRATIMETGVDLRAMTTGPRNGFFAIRDGAGSPPSYADWLYHIEPPAVVNILGQTRFTDIQGLAMHQGVLYGWSGAAGLLIVNQRNGVATDPFPGVGSPIFLETLCSHPDGRLLAAGAASFLAPDELYEIDVSTGLATLIARLPTSLDLRGIEAVGGFAITFGQPCDGAAGSARHWVTGSLRPGGQLSSMSIHHAASRPGALLLGTSTRNYGTLTLPLSLDPILSTSNCSLYVSIDVSLPMLSGTTSPATLLQTLNIPAQAAGAVFHLQHVCFEPVSGGSSWTNGVTVRL